MVHAGSPRGFGDVAGLFLLLLAGEVLPEIRHRVDAVRALECLLEALDIVDVGLDDFRALAPEFLCLVL